MTGGGLPSPQATNARDNILNDGYGGQAASLLGGLASLRAVTTVADCGVGEGVIVRSVRVPLSEVEGSRALQRRLEMRLLSRKVGFVVRLLVAHGDSGLADRYSYGLVIASTQSVNP